MYTAIILDEESRQELLRKYYEMHPLPPSGWILKAHHVTLNMGEVYKETAAEGVSQVHPNMYGALCKVSVTSVLYKADGIEAVGVSVLCETGQRVRCMNAQPHITIAHRGDVKPKTANDYPKSWLHARSALYPQYLTGRIEVVEGTIRVRKTKTKGFVILDTSGTMTKADIEGIPTP